MGNYLKRSIKTCVHFFHIFVFSPNDSPSKIIKKVFDFIKKAIFVLKIFKFLYFFLLFQYIQIQKDKWE